MFDLSTPSIDDLAKDASETETGEIPPERHIGHVVQEVSIVF
jgi:hypothetical protein